MMIIKLKFITYIIEIDLSSVIVIQILPFEFQVWYFNQATFLSLRDLSVVVFEYGFHLFNGVVFWYVHRGVISFVNVR